MCIFRRISLDVKSELNKQCDAHGDVLIENLEYEDTYVMKIVESEEIENRMGVGEKMSDTEDLNTFECVSLLSA